jgi:hypothetical protein
MVFTVRRGYLSFGGAMFVVSPFVIAGLMSLFLTAKRTMVVAAIVLASLLIPAFAVNSDLIRLAQPESVKDLLAVANTRGYNDAPIYGLGEFDRTAEFYGAGRVAYGIDGEPVIFENADQVMNEARKRGQILVLVPREYDQLIRMKTLGAEVIGDNGKFVLIAVRSA